MPAAPGKGRLVRKKITRGPRKGMTLLGYMDKNGHFTEKRDKRMGPKSGPGVKKPNARATKGGIEVRAIGGKKKNTQKGNARKGQTMQKLVDSAGRQIHRYKTKGGKTKDIVVRDENGKLLAKSSKAKKAAGGPSSSGGKKAGYKPGKQNVSSSGGKKGGYKVRPTKNPKNTVAKAGKAKAVATAGKAPKKSSAKSSAKKGKAAYQPGKKQRRRAKGSRRR